MRPDPAPPAPTYFAHGRILNAASRCSKICATQPADRGERLGCGSEADRFRVEFRHRTLVECFAARETLHFRYQSVVGASVGKTDPDVSTRPDPMP